MPSLETTEQLLAHTAWLTRVARALTNSADDADDIVQQTWLHALERPPAHGRNLRGWLGTLARNLARSKYRARATEVAHAPALPRPEQPRPPHDAVARAELQHLLLDAVLALTEPYRSTLVLRFLDELSAEEIAKKNGEPVETVRTRIKRGLDQVRARVAERLGANREQLPALLAPLFTAGVVVVTSTTKVGLLIGAAAAVLATTLVLTRANVEGGARNDAVAKTSPAPDAAATQGESAAPEVATRVVESATPAAANDVTPRRDVNASTFDLAGVVVDADGALVADATVAVVRDDSKLFASALTFVVRRDAVAQPFANDHAIMATSDAEGAFSVSGVDRLLRWRIIAFRAGRGASTLVAVDPARDASPRRLRLTLAPGIGIHGRVIDSAGDPVAGATVSLGADDPDPASSIVSMTWNVVADANGEFSQPSIPAAQVKLRASRGSVISPWMTVTSTGGTETREVTLRLAPDEHKVRIRLHGRVVDVAGVSIEVSKPFQSRLTEWERANAFTSIAELIGGPVPAVGAENPPFSRSTQVNPKPSDFTFDLPLDGDAADVPTAVAFVARNRVLAVVPLDRALLKPSERTHELPDLVVDPALLPAKPSGATVEVRVIDAATSEPVAAADLELKAWWALGMDGPWIAVSRAETLLSGLSPGRNVIVARCSGYVPGFTEVTLNAPDAALSVTIPLTRAARTIHGVVLGPERSPVAHARVWWLVPDGDGWRHGAVAASETNAEGRFAMEGVGAGGGRIAVESSDFVPAGVDVAPLADRADDVESVDDRRELEVVLARGADVTFRFTPDPSSNGIPRSLLRIVAEGGCCVWQDWGDAAGTEWISDESRHVTLSPGRYHYELTMWMGFAAAEADFEARDGTVIVIAPRSR